jgi:hypothetical protein
VPAAQLCAKSASSIRRANASNSARTFCAGRRFAAIAASMNATTRCEYWMSASCAICCLPAGKKW